MDAHTLRVLEFDRVVERLAAHTSHAMGREAALALVPTAYPEVIARRLQETREARWLRDHGSGMPLGGIRDIRDAIERASIGQVLVPQELLDVAQTCSAARRLRTFLLRQQERCSLLAEIAGNMPQPPNIEVRVGECISGSGEMRDTATPELARIRAGRKVAHGRLLDRLNSIVASERYRAYIQEPIVTLREGRYCIPVKSEYRSQFGGIVHDASSSGATVFMEPGPCIDLGNELKELQVREEQEIGRILARLTAMVGNAADDLRALVGIAANLDLANAKAVLAEAMQAEEPALNRDGKVRLVAARHPLLTGDVVPVDVEIGDRFSVLLVTGPNTGGKTVALKTVGLLTLMAQAGLQTPAAASSEMAIFEQVFADIGDEQDIQQSLSTFSAHLRNIVRIVSSIGPSALVLLDEVGAGTDPAEGAALAKAVLTEMQRRGARVIATTHYGELKEFAYLKQGIENAAVEFDRDTLRPTYRLLLGVPGSSHAFYIAGRLGLPEELVEEARSLLSRRDQSMAEVLQGIEASRARTHEMERDAAVALREAVSARSDYEARARQVADVQRSIRREAEEEARQVVRRASEKAENILAELRKMNRGQRKGATARRRLAELRSETSEALATPEPDIEPAPPPGGYAFCRGDRVHIISLGTEGSLLEEPAGGVAIVQIGAMRATLPLDVLRPARTPAREPATAQRTGAAEIAMRRAIHIAPEISIRAMRVDEAAPLLEKYIDDAYAAGIQQARIIHGRGTGALRRFVRECLKTHPVVAGFRDGEDGEGGDGATVVTFKE
ncbi:MAG TPA: endonuclease MutS2 [Chthonomonadales bacterium]|nr:endonuclease MutS2 [Chthonomonadales bacterium]